MRQPIRKSMIKPRLVLGMPRNAGIMLIAACIFIGFQQGKWISAIVLFGIVWSILAIIVSIDRRLPQIFLRSLWRAPSNHLRK